MDLVRALKTLHYRKNVKLKRVHLKLHYTILSLKDLALKPNHGTIAMI